MNAVLYPLVTLILKLKKEKSTTLKCGDKDSAVEHRCESSLFQGHT